MNSSRPSRARSWTRLLIPPAVAALVSLSVLAGYARESLWTDMSHGAGTVRRIELALAGRPAIGFGHSDDGSSSASEDPLENYKTAISLLKKSYYEGPIEPKKTRQLTYDAIRGMLDTLKDQFTSFLDPDDWSQMQVTTRGELEGIGALLEASGPDVKVVEPIEGSPAEKIGIKPDDVISRVDGKSVIGKSINDVVRLIKGPKGTLVRVGIIRGKTAMEFTIKRALVEPPVVKYWMEDAQGKIGHIVLKEFNEKSIEQLNHAFDDLDRQGMKALVFDLRYNPGGLLNVAIDVASVFIPADQSPNLDNAVVFVKEGTGNEQALRLKPPDRSYPHVPLVVLINDNSASASEIVSGAIKDYGVGTVMGQRTFGKGLVQTLFPLDDHSALRLTTAKYFTPKHTDINRKKDSDGDPIPHSGGIVPDIPIVQNEKWKAQQFSDKVDDTQLQKALEFLRDRLKGMTVAQATQSVESVH
jgi:carboxyl-terminal processing protease